jgi:hypothetical protein
MSSQAIDEAAEVQKGHFDPYQLDPSHILEPPAQMGEILKKIGPGHHLVQRYVPKNMKATKLMTWLLYAGAFVITAFVLVSEYRKYFLS